MSLALWRGGGLAQPRGAAFLGVVALLGALWTGCPARPPGPKPQPCCASAPTPSPTPAPTRATIVHLFEWPWEDVARECEQVLGPALALAVQVSPPQDHVKLPQHVWWDRYQPTGYALVARGQRPEAFAQMVKRCAQAGVQVHVDVVLNHMSAGDGEGVGGQRHQKYRYPGLYEPDDFHGCRDPIDWQRPESIWTCELLGLSDLDTSKPQVRARQRAYLDELIGLGVRGLRVDAAKHIDPKELKLILQGMDAQVTLLHEVLEGADAVKAAWYFELGRVTDFAVGESLSRVFRQGRLDTLHDFGQPGWGLLPDAHSLAFVDNHDTQRWEAGKAPLTHKERELHRLANVFLLAWPHGLARLMSSYAFEDPSAGPPRAGDALLRPLHPQTGQCQEGWVCEHRDPMMVGMMGFRAYTAHEPQVTQWWSGRPDQIALGRGASGFVVINASGQALSQQLQTPLPAGRYCDALAPGCARILQVDAQGRVQAQVPPRSALALHRGAMAP